MKKYNNTKTVIAVSNKSAILVHVVAALMISTAAIYFIVASQDYSELAQSASSSSSTESRDEGDTIATVNEIVFFIVVGIAYIAAGLKVRCTCCKENDHSMVLDGMQGFPPTADSKWI